MNRLFEAIYPNAQKSSYTELDNIEFDLTFLGKKLVKDSIVISGDLTIKKGNTYIGDNSNIRIDAFCGVHCFFDNFSSATSQGQLENIMNYPRLVRMKSEAVQDQDSLMAQVSNNVQLKLGNDTHMDTILQGTASAANVVGSLSFVMRPDIALNNSNDHIAFKSVGVCNVSTKLRSVQQVFYGSGVDNTVTYEITNVQLHYQTVDDDGVYNPIIFRVNHNINSTLSTSNQNISTRIPLVMDSFSCSFIEQVNENTYTYNTNETQVLPGVNRVEFAFNDSNSTFITFPLEYGSDILENYQRSLGNSSQSSISPKRFNNSLLKTGYGLGLYLGELVDFSNQKLGINIQSNVSSNWTMYLFAHGVVEVNA